MIIIDARLAGVTQRGIGRYSEEMLRHLDPLLPAGTTAAFVGAKAAEALAGKFRSITLFAAPERWYTFWQEQVLFTVRLIRSRPSLVHFFHWNVPLPAALLLRLLGVPFVLTIHDLLLLESGPRRDQTTLPYPLYWLKFHVWEIFVCVVSRLATAILAVSQTTKASIVSRLGVNPRRIFVVGEGFEHLDRAAAALPATPAPVSWLPYILYVGSAYPHKNLETLLRAFALLEPPGPEGALPHLVFVGIKDAFHDRLLMAIAALPALRGRLHVIDSASDEQLFVWYANARAVALPSRSEGFGLPLLEAMHVGVPVIASDIPAFLEIAGSAPVVFVAADSPDLWAQAIAQVLLLGDADRAERGRKEMNRSALYTWELAAQLVAGLYEQCGRRAGVNPAWQRLSFRFLLLLSAIPTGLAMLFLSLKGVGVVVMLALLLLLGQKTLPSATKGALGLAWFMFFLTVATHALFTYVGVHGLVVFTLAFPLVLLAVGSASTSASLRQPSIPQIVQAVFLWEILVASSWIPLPSLSHAALLAIAVVALLFAPEVSRRKAWVLLSAGLGILLLLSTAPWRT